MALYDPLRLSCCPCCTQAPLLPGGFALVGEQAKFVRGLSNQAQ
jgi:hypothetical protein